ncbi:MAG: HAD-IIA family hydrolase [Microthrixaceae bacterium]
MEDLGGVLLDIDGVLVVSWEPVPGAVGAVSRLRDAGVALRFVTNTTSRAPSEIAATLRSCGFELDDAELLTAGSATEDLLAADFAGASALVLNDGPLELPAGMRAVSGPDAEHADVVVIGGAGESFDWPALNTALRALLAGASLVGMHGAMAWQTDRGACIDGGAYLRMLAETAGVEPTVVGKPAPGLFEAACRSMGTDPSEALMVGDDLHSDVLAAQALGMRGVLVRTGKFRPEVLDSAGEAPDHVIDSVAALPALLGLEGSS